MKQLFFGLGLMAVIVISGLFLGNRLEEIHHPQAKDLERAAACALKEDWGQATALMTRAKKAWLDNRNLTAALIHHDPLSHIDTRFAELEVHAAARNAPEFSAGCAGLAQDLRSVPKSHNLSWWNLL